MAIEALQQKKQQRNLIFVFSLIILITAFVIWQGFFKKPVSYTPGGYTFQKLPVNINFDALGNDIFIQMQSFSEIRPFIEIPPEEEKPGVQIGRDNPFLPY